MRKWSGLWGLVMILCLFFVGCGEKGIQEKNTAIYDGDVYEENGLPKEQKVTIKTIFPVAGIGKEYFEYAVKSFEEKFPNVEIDVRWIEEGNNIYKSMMRTLLQSGNEKEMYTIFPSFGSDIIKGLALEGKLEAQDDLWERFLYDSPKTSVKDMVIIDKREVFIGNHLYSIPSQVNIYGLYYNKNMFEDNGWNEEPNNWDEFMALCQKIKATGTYPMVMAGKYPYYFMYGWGAIPYCVGGDEYRDAEYKYLPDVYKSVSYKDMLIKMEQFTKKSYFHPGTVSFDHTQSQMEFLQGKAAMITNATWVANEMKNVTPKGFKWGFMPFPGNDNSSSKKVVLSQGSSGLLIWKNKPGIEKKWAKEFVLWLLNLDVQKIIAQHGGVPIRKDFIKEQKNLTKISPSVFVALEKINGKENISIVNKDIRIKTISNTEMAKLPKVMQDGFVSIVSGNKSAVAVADEINKQYMKGLKGDSF